MKKNIVLILTLLILIITCRVPDSLSAAKEQESPSSGGVKVYSLKQLREDFAQLKTTLEFQHPMLYTNKDELRQLYETQAQLLNKPMGEREFYRILMPIVAKLNCGHTNLSLSKKSEEYFSKNGRYLPLSIKVIADRAYLDRNWAATTIPPGAEILAVNGKPVREILAVFLNNIPADGYNTSKKYYVVNHWFSESYLSLIEAPEQFVVTYRAPDGGNNAEATVAPMNREQLEQAVKKFSPAAKEGENGLYWFRFSGDIATLTIKSFGFYDAPNKDKFKAFLNDFFKALAERKSSNLILDLRDNWGGDPYCSSHLFKFLIKQPSPYFAADSPYYFDLKEPLKPAANNFQGNLYVLTNGASFSSTGHLCSLLRYHQIGTFIGDETGGSYVCTDGSRDITLKNTGLRLHYATMAFKTAVTGLTPGRGIIPDYAVTPTIDDYLKDKDAEMEVALDLIARTNK